MTISLRPHHLLCILAFVGKGYTPEFAINLAMIVERLANGEEIMIVEGADDVCAPMLDDQASHCHRCSVKERDQIAAQNIGKLLERSIQPGERLILGPDLLERLRKAFSSGQIRTACRGCEWDGFCSSIAFNDYDGATLCAHSSKNITHS